MQRLLFFDKNIPNKTILFKQVLSYFRILSITKQL